MRKKGGQSSLEYATLIIVIMGVLIAMGTYFKRGVQGRWKEAVDGLGDQYDPRVTDSNITERISSFSETRITALPVNGGIWTMRDDISNSVETKSGSTRVGAF